MLCGTQFSIVKPIHMYCGKSLYFSNSCAFFWGAFHYRTLCLAFFFSFSWKSNYNIIILARSFIVKIDHSRSSLLRCNSSPHCWCIHIHKKKPARFVRFYYSVRWTHLFINSGESANKNTHATKLNKKWTRAAPANTPHIICSICLGEDADDDNRLGADTINNNNNKMRLSKKNK